MVLEKGIIYKIFNDQYKHLVYIGQTRQLLEDRWKQHKRDAKNFEINQIPTKAQGKLAKLHRAMRLLEEQNYQIEEIEKFEFDDLNELLNKLDERENFFIDKYNSIETGWNKQYASKIKRPIGIKYEKTWHNIAAEKGVNVRKLCYQVNAKKISIEEAVKNIKELEKNPKRIYVYAQQQYSFIRDLKIYDKNNIGKDVIEARIRSNLKKFNLITKFNDITNTLTIYLKDFIFKDKKTYSEKVINTPKGKFSGSIASLHKLLFPLFPKVVPPLDKYTTVQGKFRKGYTSEQAFGFRLPPFLAEIEFYLNEKNYSWGEVDGEIIEPNLKCLKTRPKYIILHSLQVIYLYQKDWINAYKLNDSKKVIRLLADDYSPEDVLKEFGRVP